MKSNLGTEIYALNLRTPLLEQFALPLLLTLAAAIMFLFFTLSILQIANLVPPGTEHEDYRIIAMEVSVVLGGGLTFVVVVIPRLIWKRKLIAIHENGLRTENDAWRWEEISGISMLSDLESAYCQVYVEDYPVWNGILRSEKRLDILQLLTNNTRKFILPRLEEQYRLGETLSFGNMMISQKYIILNGIEYPLTSFQVQTDNKNRRLIVRRNNGEVVATISFIGRPNSHLISLLLSGEQNL